MKLLLLQCMMLSVIKSDEILEFQKSNALFSADLYKEISTREAANFLVCPLSAQIVLALATVGARENSALQLSNCLHLPNDLVKIQSIFEKINDKFEVSQSYQLSSANKIYLSEKSDIKNNYRNIAVNTFKADIEVINFDDSEEAAEIINQWVKSKTSNKITDIIEKNSLSPSTFAILVNALYFNGNWIHEFGNNGDYKQNFFISESENVSTNFMMQRNIFNYCYNEKLRVEFLELPFVGDDVTMTIALPKDNQGLKKIEEDHNITEVLLSQSFQKLDAFISMPKFTMGSMIDLKKILKVLGVTDPFNLNANFNGITDGPIYIDEVVQKTFIEINEKGATAAAATKISFTTVSMPVVTFIADHPFMYYLRHRTTGIIFIGRFSSP